MPGGKEPNIRPKTDPRRPHCWWGPRGGESFYLETQTRENRSEFQEVLRGGWVALAKDEEAVNGMWHAKDEGKDSGALTNGHGGLWSALMLYKKKLVVAGMTPTNRTVPAGPTASPGNKVDAFLTRWAEPPAPPAPITTAADGTIAIPAASFTTKNASAPISVMKSFDEGTQLLSNGCTSTVGPPCFHPESSSWGYDVTAAAAGSFYLTTNFSTCACRASPRRACACAPLRTHLLPRRRHGC